MKLWKSAHGVLPYDQYERLVYHAGMLGLPTPTDPTTVLSVQVEINDARYNAGLSIVFKIRYSLNA